MSVEVAEIIDRLKTDVIDLAAADAAAALSARGFAVSRFSPGDATSYLMIIIEFPMGPERFRMASNFGPAYPIPGHFKPDPGYCAEKYLMRQHANLHTGVVYSEFIKALGRHMAQ